MSCLAAFDQFLEQTAKLPQALRHDSRSKHGDQVEVRGIRLTVEEPFKVHRLDPANKIGSPMLARD